MLNCGLKFWKEKNKYKNENPPQVNLKIKATWKWTSTIPNITWKIIFKFICNGIPI